MSKLALSASFEYQCYGSTDIINMFTHTVRRRQIMKVDPPVKGYPFRGDPPPLLCEVNQ